MLTKEDNELLTRVGPGTPMGELLRRYWHPFLLSSELPERDGAPLRVKLLGEDLIAFRDTNGRVGLVAAHCAHRGASLFFGRNEEHGIRCVYHGWKYDVTGQCVDMPSEPPESSFRDKIRLTAYPCQERGGVVWAYLGPLAEPPGLPDLPWFLMPEGHRFVSKRLESCNWVQAFEGGIDSSHSSFLHSRLRLEQYHEDGGAGLSPKVMEYKQRDRHPRFEVVDTDFGVWVAARRDAEPGAYLWRMTPFLMPYWTMTPGNEVSTEQTDRRQGGHAWVPMDDEHTISWSFSCRFKQPYTEDEIAHLFNYPQSGIHVGVPGGILPPTSEPMGAWRPAANQDNDYLIDYEEQRTRRFFGVMNLGMQDQAVQESMGAIYDRTQEHLGGSDTGIIQVRNRLLRAAKALLSGGEPPPGSTDPLAYRVRSAVVVLPHGVQWLEEAREYLVAQPGVDYVRA